MEATDKRENKRPHIHCYIVSPIYTPANQIHDFSIPQITILFQLSVQSQIHLSITLQILAISSSFIAANLAAATSFTFPFQTPPIRQLFRLEV